MKQLQPRDGPLAATSANLPDITQIQNGLHNASPRLDDGLSNSVAFSSQRNNNSGPISSWSGLFKPTNENFILAILTLDLAKL